MHKAKITFISTMCDKTSEYHDFFEKNITNAQIGILVLLELALKKIYTYDDMIVRDMITIKIESFNCTGESFLEKTTFHLKSMPNF